MQAQAQTQEAAVDTGPDGVDPGVMAILEKAQQEAPAEPEPTPAPTPPKPAEDPVDAPTEETKAQTLQRLEELTQGRRGKDADEIRSMHAPGEPSIEEVFQVDPVGAIRTLVKKIVGDDEAKIKAFIEGDIYTPLMVDVLGKDADQLDPNLRTRLEVNGLNRKLAAETRKREAQEKRAEELRIQQEHDSKVAVVKGTISTWIQERSQTYPYLAAQPHPDGLVFELMRDDPKLTPEKAAEWANEYYERDASKYSKLLLGSHGNAEKQAIVKGQSARPASLTNSGATASVATDSGKPNLDDPDASAEYWGNLLQRNPDEVKRLYQARR